MTRLPSLTVRVPHLFVTIALVYSGCLRRGASVVAAVSEATATDHINGEADGLFTASTVSGGVDTSYFRAGVSTATEQAIRRGRRFGSYGRRGDTVEDHDSDIDSDEIGDVSGERPLWIVQVVHSRESELCYEPTGFPIARNDHVIVPTRYGNDLGRVLGPLQSGDTGPWREVRTITRPATDLDLSMSAENRIEEDEAFVVARRKIRERDLPMELVSVHVVLDEPRIVFFFTSEGRVDFRALVRDLVDVYHKRIELRQIGVRDESRILGGRGVCGREFCCSCISDHLRPVSIKMAKAQKLSLNSMKISGPCGRLLCCLAYEYEHYLEARGNTPAEGTRVTVDGTEYRIREVNIISRRAYLQGPDGAPLTLPLDAFHLVGDKGRWEVTPPDTEAYTD